MTEDNIKPVPVYIITGKRREGKTSFLADVAEKLKDASLDVDGILAIATSKEDLPYKYSLMHIKTGKIISLCHRNPTGGWKKIGPFYFNPAALEAGNRILTHPELVKSDLVIIDEIGKFELEDMVWADSLTLLLKNSCCLLILSVRQTFVEQVIRKWDLHNFEVIDISHTTPLAVSEEIIERIKIN